MIAKLSLLSTLCVATLAVDAAVIQPEALLRPRSREYTARSALEGAYIAKRGGPAGQADHTCGNSNGAILNPATIVRDALVAGLPYASPTGVVFMRASISDISGCGPYVCSVSPDALGATWIDMPVLTNVPTAQAGCGSEGQLTDYSLVAQVPEGAVCTGDQGACLVMCKTEKSTLGNCAAIALQASSESQSDASFSSSAAEPATAAGESSSSDRAYSSIAVPQSASSPPAPTAQPPTLATRPASFTSMPGLPPTTSSRRISSADESYKPIATIVGFSGNNGPGGLAEQQQIGTNGFAVSKADLDAEEALASAASRNGASMAGVAIALLLAMYSA